MYTDKIIIKGAREHNLKNLDIEIPRNKFIVITGVSGSGKSSLAFDTIYAEGQRKYVESLSSYARQFLEQMQKPDLDSIEGLSPAISIEQKTTSKNPRSTVGTITEIYDYLRVFFARLGKPYCHNCGKPIQSQTVTEITNTILNYPFETKINILSPLVRDRKGEYKKLLINLKKDGFSRIKIDGEITNLHQTINLDKNIKHNIDLFIDRLVLKEGIKTRLVDSIELALSLSDGLVKIEILEDVTKDLIFSQYFSCIDCGISYPEIEPRIFSFNSPHGACPECSGLGFNMTFDKNLIIADLSKSIINGGLAIWPESIPDYIFQTLQAVAKHYEFTLDLPIKELSQKAINILFYGSQNELISYKYEAGNRIYKNKAPFPGIINTLKNRYKETESETIRYDLERFMIKSKCSACKGFRLKKESLHIKINDKNISEVCEMQIEQCIHFFENLNFSSFEKKIGEKLIAEIKSRLIFLSNVGLNYLSLSRSSNTLSGGEGQRIRLATQIGSSLVGVLYILDEPSIGLHQKDNHRLLNSLKSLKDIGNTVIVVEHDKDTIETADHIIDMGPGAGRTGGEIVAQGTLDMVLKSNTSLTAKYLSGRKSIPVPKKTRPGNSTFLELKGATLHNLKKIDVKIPCGCLTCITGVSGSGKSSLIIQTLYRAMKNSLYSPLKIEDNFSSLLGYENFDKIIDIDQSPIGRTPRSNPATYSGLFTSLRELFASLPEAKARGYKLGRFSFNVKGGRCETCNGDGVIRVEMHFLPDHYVVCESCNGKRYNRETLEIRYRGKNISEVLNITVEEGMDFFSKIPSISHKLATLNEVGLGYITLGQSATTLSGGEAQRLKLAKELSKKSTGKTLYILDEPTTGLHFEDINNLLKVLHSLVDKGNTMIIIEHNMDIIKTADYVIDMGPEGGDKGGFIVAHGTPKEIASCDKSYTGNFLKNFFTF